MPVTPGIYALGELLQRQTEWSEPMYRNPPPRYLFRGQPARFGGIRSSLGRFDPWDEVAFTQHYTICRYAKNGHIGLRQSKRQPPLLDDDAVAVLQHYGMRTPFIDLTSDLQTALFFAMFDTKPDEECHLYVLDWKKLPGDYRIISHDFVFGDSWPTNRWVRQKGYAVAPRNWHYATTVRDWDLLNSPAYKALDRYTFKSDQAFLKPHANLLSKTGDPIPRQLKETLLNFLESWDFVHPDVKARIQQI